MQELNHKVNLLTTENARISGQHQKIQGEVNCSQSGYKRLEILVTEKERLLSEKRIDNDDKDHKIYELGNEIRLLATENERLTLNNEEKSAKFENIESFRLELESDIKKVIEENERLENVIWDKDRQIESLQDDCAQSEIKLTGEMQAKLNSLTSANERINAELESKFDEVADWKKVYDEVDHSLKLKEVSFAKSMERENLLENETKQVKSEKISLSDALSKVKRENLTLESALHEYESEMENLKRCLNETTRDVKSREHTVEEQETLLLEIRIKLESLQATLKSRDTEDARLRTSVGEKEGIIMQKNKLHAE